MTKKELVLERLHRNGVTSPFSSIEMCVRNLGGIQSQVQQFAELAIINRSVGASSMSVLAKAYNSHSLINFWGQRNTLHIYTATDWDMICDVYHNRTYIQSQVSVYPEFFAKLTEQIQIAATVGGPMERAQIDELVKALAPEELKGKDFLTYMVLNYLCAKGVLFGIPSKPSVKKFAHFSALSKAGWQYSTEGAALSLDEMLLRYFRYYGPATVQDFSHWSGLPIMAFREAFDRLAPKFESITLGKHTYYSSGSVEVKNTRKLCLLGKFDPLFVSYRHKDWIATPEQQKQIWRSAGHVEAVILEGAKLIGTWRHTLRSSKMTIWVEPMAEISENTTKRIQAKAERLSHFWLKDLEGVVYK